MFETKEQLQKLNIKPVIKKDEYYENNKCFAIRSQRVSQERGINELYIKNLKKDEVYKEVCEDVEKILNLSKELKHIKMYSNSSIIVFDLQLDE